MDGKFMRYVAGVVALAALAIVADGKAMAQVPVPTACGQYSASAGRPGQRIAIEVWLASAPRQGYGYLGDSVEVWANGVKIGAVPTNRLVIRRDGSIGVGMLLWTVPAASRPGSTISLSIIYRGRGYYTASTGSGSVSVTR